MLKTLKDMFVILMCILFIGFYIWAIGGFFLYAWGLK
jgi:hypothetical protein